MPHGRTDENQDPITDGSSNATADQAVEGQPSAESRYIETPISREATRIPDDQKHDQLAEKEARAETRQEALLDEAIEETFPGSDPISPKHIT